MVMDSHWFAFPRLNCFSLSQSLSFPLIFYSCSMCLFLSICFVLPFFRFTSFSALLFAVCVASLRVVSSAWIGAIGLWVHGVLPLQSNIMDTIDGGTATVNAQSIIHQSAAGLLILLMTASFVFLFSLSCCGRANLGWCRLFLLLFSRYRTAIVCLFLSLFVDLRACAQSSFLFVSFSIICV